MLDKNDLDTLLDILLKRLLDKNTFNAIMVDQESNNQRRHDESVELQKKEIDLLERLLVLIPQAAWRAPVSPMGLSNPPMGMFNPFTGGNY
jgi:hypothetical protein